MIRSVNEGTRGNLMGATIYYRSLRKVDEAERNLIEADTSAAEASRTWLSCEPVHLYLSDDGLLEGGSKPNFAPDDQDISAAEESGLPDGTVLDLIDVLSRLSRDHNIDWEIIFEEGPAVGCIRNGH